MGVFNLPEAIRLATPEEIAEIAGHSDLTQQSSVYKFRNNTGVVRTVVELDPVEFAPEATTRERAMFIWGMEAMMRAHGLEAYYFNVPATEIEWQETVKHWGAKPTSPSPELRFRKEL